MNWNILFKYIRGNCTEGELHKLGVWLQEDSANEDFFISFIEEWSDENIEYDSDARFEWERFRKKHIVENQETEISVQPNQSAPLAKGAQFGSPGRSRSVAYWSYSAAAVMLLILAIIFTIRQFNSTIDENQQEQISYQEITTVQGQRTNLKLSDGTKITLNSSSHLRIPKDYGKDTRTLYLQGEAFFEVIHDEDNPFIVISHNTYTRDLGTEFNVSAYDTSTVEVAVKEGLVSLGRVQQGTPQKEIVEITPGKLGVLRELGGLTVTDIQHMDKYVGWTQGKLVFEQTPFPEVTQRLERWFDIDCRVEGADSTILSQRTLTASYNNMPMTEVLKVLSISMDVTYNRQGRTIIFRDREEAAKQ